MNEGVVVVKFFCGLTLGVIGTAAFCYGGNDDNKIGGIVIGTVLGAALAVVSLVLFLQYCAKEMKQEQAKKENKDKWWMTGDKPPWERDDDDD
jgi:nitric oxide reductase large subunit